MMKNVKMYTNSLGIVTFLNIKCVYSSIFINVAWFSCLRSRKKSLVISTPRYFPSKKTYKAKILM